MDLTGNTILITGGASGIGLELAKQLTAKGNKVIITGRDLNRLENARASSGAVAVIQSDVAESRDIESLHTRIVQDFPGLNFLINNAGIMRNLNLHKAPEDLEDLTTEIDVNFRGTVRMCRKFLDHLKTKKSAAIVNVSSGLAFVPVPSFPIYCATKAALHSFTQSLRVQLKRTNVKVFELAPPLTKTAMADGMSATDRENVSIMPVEDMVAATLNGLERDRFEIRPGQANQLKIMSRVAPEFILKQLSRPMDRILAQMRY